MQFRFFLLFLLITGLLQSQETMNWTIMHYSAGSNSSEKDLLNDIEEMKVGKQSDKYNLVVLVDRIEGFSNDSTTLDGNFNDTRLYQIDQQSYLRIDGNEYFPNIKNDSSFELNMADANTLKKFVQYCKKYYPANHYLLILRSHGNGLGMCGDSENGLHDKLYSAEISNELTANESVDILGLDVCSMAGMENLYQWRPGTNSFSADYVIASSPLSGPWAYDKILERLSFDESDSSKFDPGKLDPLQFSQMIYDEIYSNQGWASWGLFDNKKIYDLKLKIDKASVPLSNENKDSIFSIIENTLAYYHNTSNDKEIAQLTFPYIDAYHFWSQISNHNSFSKETKESAVQVCKSIDQLVIQSYYGDGYLPPTNNFKEGKNGIYLIIPNGHKIFSQSNYSFWSHCSWFHPDDRSMHPNSFGQYNWCSDGAIRGNNKVENFYELLDFLFDDNNDESGGVNQYIW